MQQMLCRGITILFLVFFTWQDIRSGRISMTGVLLFAAAGVLWNVVYGRSWQFCAEGIVPGIGILLFGKVSGEQIGYGDGLVLSAMGLFLTGREVAGLLSGAVFLCALGTVILFFSGKLKRRMSLPFLPFLTAAYGIMLIGTAIE